MESNQKSGMLTPTEKHIVAAATVFIKTVEFGYKVDCFKTLFLSELFSGLPSSREAHIQIEKFERMTNKFIKRFPIEEIRSLPPDKANKIIGAETHRVNQQGKIIDRMCMKVIEEKVKQSMNEQGGKLPKSFIKMKTRKFIESRNSLCHQASDEFVRHTLDAVVQQCSLNG